MNNCGFTEDAIQKFINLGLITRTDHAMNIRQLSFSGLGTYVSLLEQGRKALLNCIQKNKYSQISQNELLKRTIPKCNANTPCLGMELHIYDLIGAKLVAVDSLPNDILIRKI